VTDSSFNKTILSTDYKLYCDSASNSYQSSVRAWSSTITVPVCQPDFDVTSKNKCKGTNVGYGDDLVYNSDPMIKLYEGKVTLNLNAFYGFNSNVDLSTYGSSTVTPSVTFTSPYPTDNSGGKVGKIDLNYSLNQTDYDFLKANHTSPIIDTFYLTATSGSIVKNYTVNFCDGSAPTKFKPIYTPR
jgi:hypothetical protein